MEKTNKNIIAPVLVLVAICLVASAMLAGVFQVASPIIDTRAAEAATQARSAVLPDGDTFKKWEGELAEGVQDAYTAENGAGMVCSTAFNGFNGAVELMIGMDAEGKVTGIQVMSQSETPGVGSNALTEEFRSRFTGLTSADGVDAYSGATFTSKAVKNGVNAAAAQFEIIGNSDGGTGAPTEEDLTQDALKAIFTNGNFDQINVDSPVGGVKTVLTDTNASAYAMIVEKTGYNKEDVIRVVVGIDKDGAVISVVPVYSKEVEGIGDVALANRNFMDQFAGVTAVNGLTENSGSDNTAGPRTIEVKKGADTVQVDAVSEATETCAAVADAVKAALEQYAALPH